MKKNATLCLFLFTVLLSCKKGNSGSGSYHMTATVGGTAKTFNTAVVATKDTVGTYVFITVTGVASATTGEEINLTLDNSNGGIIKPGTILDTDLKFNLACTYSPSIGVSYIAGTAVADLAAGTGVTIVNHLKLVITSLNNTAIGGTFSGDCYANGAVGGAIKTVTSGDFYVKFQQ